MIIPPGPMPSNIFPGFVLNTLQSLRHPIFLFSYSAPVAKQASSITFNLNFFAIDLIFDILHGLPNICTGKITLVFLVIFFSIISSSIFKVFAFMSIHFIFAPTKLIA